MDKFYAVTKDDVYKAFLIWNKEYENNKEDFSSLDEGSAESRAEAQTDKFLKLITGE